MSFNQEGWLLLCVVSYLIFLLLIAFSQLGSEKSLENHVMPLQRLGICRLSGSLWLSSTTVLFFVVVPSVTYIYGFSRLSFVLSWLCGLALLFFVCLPRYQKKLSTYVYTFCQWLSIRFENPLVGKLCCVISTMGLTLFASAGLALVANLFCGAFSLHYTIALACALVFGLILLLICGTMAQNTTNIFSVVLSFVLLIGLSIVSLAVFAKDYPQTNLFASPVTSPKFSWLTLFSDLSMGLGAFALIPAYASMHNCEKKALKPASIVCISLAVVSLIGSVVLGLTFRWHDPSLRTTLQAESISLCVAQLPSIPKFCSGLLCLGLFACGMASLCFNLRYSSNSFVYNVLSVHVKNKSSQALLRCRVVTILALSLLSFLFALNPNFSTQKLVTFGWVLMGASLSPLFIFALFVEKFNGKGAIICCSVGLLFALVGIAVPALHPYLPLLGLVGAVIGSILGLIISEKPKSKSEELMEN